MFDTETTGVDHATGDRVVEIGGIELLNHIPTGRHYHVYLNPERPMSQGAFEVHGLSDAFLADKTVFRAVADEMHAFFGDARLIAHNASFDIAFLNAEFARTGHPSLGLERVVDTLVLARRKHPGASNSLDALCQRYGIDNARRTKHGALLDAELLAGGLYRADRRPAARSRPRHRARHHAPGARRHHRPTASQNEHVRDRCPVR